MEPSSRTRWLAAVTAGSAVAIAVAVRRRRVSRRIREYRARIRADSAPVAGGPYDPDGVTDLPAPVRRYFENVLESGRPHVAGAALAQTGDFRLGGAAAPWHPFTATQS